MIAKLIAWGEDRTQSIERLRRALSEMRVEGISTSTPLFELILADEEFRAGELDITMLERKLASGEWLPADSGSDGDLALVAAAIAHAIRQSQVTSTPASGDGRGHRDRWREAARREGVGGGAWT